MLWIPYAVLYSFFFFTGLCLGSFCNVLVYRIPLGISFARGRSFCPACRHTLAPRDLVPLFSWLALRGKCRYCGARIAPRYPLVELAGGALAVLSALRFGFTAMAAVAFCCCLTLLTVALIDADTREIPDGLVLALAVLAVFSYLLYNQIGIVERLLGAVCISVPMLLLDCVKPTSFGGGDIKLCAAAGLLLGWKGMLVAAFVSLVTGGAYGAYLLRVKGESGKAHFAFGPFLSLGIALALFAGEAILFWYLGLFGLA